jgi:8-oxo-dGTP pyrophosphatase MutT (NUDIX family)
MKQAVGVIIHDPEGRVLLQHRDAAAPTNANKWGLWGGSIEPGESIIEATIREIEEELSIRIEPGDITFFGQYDDEQLQSELHVYTLPDVGAFQYVQREGDGMRFFTRDELVGLDMTPRTRLSLQDYFGITL